MREQPAEDSVRSNRASLSARSKWKQFYFDAYSTEQRTVQGKEVTLYRIKVVQRSTQQEVAHTWARYSDIVDVHAALLKINSALPTLPTKAVMNNKSPEVLRSRSQAIAALLEAAKNSRACRSHPSFRRLVEFDADEYVPAAPKDSAGGETSPRAAEDVPMDESQTTVKAGDAATEEKSKAPTDRPIGSGVKLSTSIDLASSAGFPSDVVPAGTVCRVVDNKPGGALVETKEWRFHIKAQDIDAESPPQSSIPSAQVVEKLAPGPLTDSLPFTTQSTLSTVLPPVELVVSDGWDKKKLPSACMRDFPEVAERVSYHHKDKPEVQPTPAVRLSAEVNCTVSGFARYFKSDTRETVLKQFDELIDRVITIESMGKKGDICQNLLTSPSFIVSPRDFVYYTVSTHISPAEMDRRGISKEKGSGGRLGYVVGARSVTNAKAPPGGKYVRGTINIMGYIAVPMGESKIHLTEVNLVDAGAALPKALLARAEDIKAKRFVRLVDRLEKFYKSSKDRLIKSEVARPFRCRVGADVPSPYSPPTTEVEPEETNEKEEEDGTGEVPDVVVPSLEPPPPPQKPPRGSRGAGALSKLLLTGGILTAAGVAYSRRSAAQESTVAHTLKSKL